ncbi:D site-binding protein [Trichinella spiralis]|uniref:D site-binding protein n=1 Tax=Trichinella spiralis TaxID=6334 RepID=A0ABR3K5C1_TRISP
MEKYSKRRLRNSNSTRKLKLVRRFREDCIYEKFFMLKEEHALLRFQLQMLQHEVQHLKSLILTRHKTTCSTEND